MRICIAGAGAIGGALAARLAHAGQDVSVLARGATLAALRADGLTLRDLSGEVRARVPASDTADFGPQDAIFLCTKTHHLAEMLALCAPMIGPDTVIVPAVNGIPWWYFHAEGGPHAGKPVAAVDPDGALLAVTPLAQLVGCVVYMTAETPKPGTVLSNSPHRLVLGEPGGGLSPRVEQLCQALTGAGIETQASPRIRDGIWSKVAANLSSNPLSVAAGGATLGQIYGQEPLRSLAENVIRETMAVAQAYGAQLANDPATMVERAAKLGDFRTSMLQDFHAGRPLELAAIGDAVLELAERYDIPMPTTRSILSITRFRDARRSGY
ncbi:MAG TPA: 2-dehydropantoate 2-reductase [Bordetella sp.]